MSRENLVELLDNVPYTSNEQELFNNAADEIERLRDELETVKAVLEELRK